MHSEKVCPAPCRAWARQIACLNLVFGALRTRVRWVVSYVRDRTTGLRRRPMPAARPFLRLRACASARHFRFASSDRATSARGTCCPRDSGMEFFWGQAAIYSLDIFSRLSVLKHYKGWRCVRPRDSPGHRGSPHTGGWAADTHEELSAASLVSRRPDLLAQTARNPSSRSALEPAARSAELRLEPSSGRVSAIPWRWTNTHTTRTDASRDHPMFTEGLATAMGVCGPR